MHIAEKYFSHFLALIHDPGPLQFPPWAAPGRRQTGLPGRFSKDSRCTCNQTPGSPLLFVRAVTIMTFGPLPPTPQFFGLSTSKPVALAICTSGDHVGPLCPDGGLRPDWPSPHCQSLQLRILGESGDYPVRARAVRHQSRVFGRGFITFHGSARRRADLGYDGSRPADCFHLFKIINRPFPVS